MVSKSTYSLVQNTFCPKSLCGKVYKIGLNSKTLLSKGPNVLENHFKRGVESKNLL